MRCVGRTSMMHSATINHVPLEMHTGMTCKDSGKLKIRPLKRFFVCTKARGKRTWPGHLREIRPRHVMKYVNGETLTERGHF